MFRNEGAFTDHVERALREVGYSTKREVPVRTGHRLDILATKDSVKAGIEVKFERRGLLDDLTKCERLLRLPEVDEMYACGPKVFMSEDAHALAARLGIGLLAIQDSGELEWMVPCRRLDPADLTVGGSYGSVVEAGGEATYTATVSNNGQKAAVDLQVRLVMAGPFVAPHPSKARARRDLLDGHDQWTAPVVCKVKRRTKPGKYSLILSLTAANVARQDRKLEYEVRPATG